jgi:3-deoxy-D-manno-octulosonic-acid transferase
MASQLYQLGIKLLNIYLKLSAVLGNKKAKIGNQGRGYWKENIKKLNSNKITFWVHAASHGEAIMAVPLIDEILKNDNHQVAISFFSPSGFENFKYQNSDLFKFYLPIDTKKNSAKVVAFIKPKLIIFIKYDLWLNLILECQNQEIPTFLVSSKFRKNQWYFKFFAGNSLRILKSMTKIFTLDHSSLDLLKSKRFTNANYCGDLRYDQVNNIKDSKKIKNFNIGKPCVILGSSWETEENLVIDIIKDLKHINWIIVPHEINHKNLLKLKSRFADNCLLLSETNFSKSNPKVLIIDEIGLLANLYEFSDIAFIGGGFSGKLHNILEAGAKGNVILFGPKIEKFPEAQLMLKENVAFKINNSSELKLKILELLENSKELENKKNHIKKIIQNKIGATKIVWSEIKKII